jgi:D-glycero-alpha-D-manno-heptose-7-phosphate kinase
VIITRSPLRISLGGGGTDLPSYYSRFGGFVISAAIDKYVYVAVHRRFTDGFLLKYSWTESADELEKINHPIIREALRMVEIKETNLEITSMADIPSGTGLGSSGSFTTALLKALFAYKNTVIHPGELAEDAFRLEYEILGEPVGKQDQYISVFGGITCFTFRGDGRVISERLAINDDTYNDLEENLLLFFTGYTRSSSSILREQLNRTVKSDKAMLTGLDYIKDFGLLIQKALEAGDTRKFASLMHSHWYEKQQRSGVMSNQLINEAYEYAMMNGALGGKLVGAGGGGFLLFYAEDKAKLRAAMREKNLQEVRFRFEPEGTKILVNQ